MEEDRSPDEMMSFTITFYRLDTHATYRAKRSVVEQIASDFIKQKTLGTYAVETLQQRPSLLALRFGDVLFIG